MALVLRDRIVHVTLLIINNTIIYSSVIIPILLFKINSTNAVNPTIAVVLLVILLDTALCALALANLQRLKFLYRFIITISLLGYFLTIPFLLLILDDNPNCSNYYKWLFIIPFCIAVVAVIDVEYHYNDYFKEDHFNKYLKKDQVNEGSLTTYCNNVTIKGNPEKLEIENYHTYITIEGSSDKLKHAYNCYKVSMYGAHLTICTTSLYTIKWCLLTVYRISNATTFYYFTPLPLLLPVLTYFAIFIGTRKLSKSVMFIYFITFILQILYTSTSIRDLLLKEKDKCWSFFEHDCFALSNKLPNGFKQLSDGIRIFVFAAIETISLFITIIVFIFLIYYWITAYDLEELKCFLEYVPAKEFDYDDKCWLTKDLEKYNKKPFLSSIPNSKKQAATNTSKSLTD
ncbi:hypothetical protein F8M41_018559 [Gigaspora margarita]|uniref:Uncharacterized protein n=1 Tax=Gigaspora margarita TaxID=4874 RepID=A0A8H4ALD5_GIGMA|nr:hypothetical protein F8M41_018559 [Gigaspora margarita]